MASLSLVTALKDGFEYFEQTIASVLAQTHTDWEWIIVDDGSVIPVKEAFMRLAQDPRVTILRNEPARGQTYGLNRGIRECRSDWVVRMDGDDLCSPDRLKRIYSAIQAQPEARLIFSEYDVIDELGEQIAVVRYRHPLPDGFFAYLERRNNPICHPTVAFKKLSPQGALYLYREDLKNAQDYALWKTILQDSGPRSLVALEGSLIRYRVVRSSLSGMRAPEQKVELKAIQRGEVVREQERPGRMLEGKKQMGMQGYRLLYYRFVGDSPAFWTTLDFKLLRDSFAFPDVVLKSAAYFFLRPAKTLLKQQMFGGSFR